MRLVAKPPEIGAILLEKVEFATTRVLLSTAIGAETLVRCKSLTLEF